MESPRKIASLKVSFFFVALFDGTRLTVFFPRVQKQVIDNLVQVTIHGRIDSQKSTGYFIFVMPDNPRRSARSIPTPALVSTTALPPKPKNVANGKAAPKKSTKPAAVKSITTRKATIKKGSTAMVSKPTTMGNGGNGKGNDGGNGDGGNGDDDGEGNNGRDNSNGNGEGNDGGNGEGNDGGNGEGNDGGDSDGEGNDGNCDGNDDGDDFGDQAGRIADAPAHDDDTEPEGPVALTPPKPTGTSIVKTQRFILTATESGKRKSLTATSFPVSTNMGWGADTPIGPHDDTDDIVEQPAKRTKAVKGKGKMGTTMARPGTVHTTTGRGAPPGKSITSGPQPQSERELQEQLSLVTGTFIIAFIQPCMRSLTSVP